MFSGLTDGQFYRNFGYSALLHGLLILLAYLSGKLFLSGSPSSQVEVIRASVRVDVVGMPKFTIQELKNMDSEALNQPKEESAPTKEAIKKESEAPDVVKSGDLVIEEKDQGKKQSFLNIISDYSKKKIGSVEQKKSVGIGQGKNREALILEGNRLSKGSALIGDYSDEQNSEFSAYVQGLPELVRNRWKLPGYLKERQLKCKIMIYISSSGELIKVDLIESSGTSEYDARAERAIREAAPFPRPSSVVAHRLSNSGVILRFPL